MLSAALQPLASYRQFIIYRAVPSKDRPGKTEKFPCSPSGVVSNAHDPSNWLDEASAATLATVMGPGYGVGFVLTREDPLFCIDLDNCATPTGWSDGALALCAQFPGAGIEVSRSGRGLHIWGTGTMPPHSCKNTALGYEAYAADRFIALGLPGATGNASADCTAALHRVVAQYFPPSAAPATPSDWTTEPCAEWVGPEDDHELIRRILSSKPSTASVFGGKCTVIDLWDRDVDALARSYPSASPNQPFGESEADAALAQHLCFWAGKDCERVLRLMQMSGLKRDKWEREDYLTRTIQRACAMATNVYHERRADGREAEDVSAPAVVPVKSGGRLANGDTFLDAGAQLKLWAGFTYVTEQNSIVTDTGQILGPDQFKNKYGGWSFVMGHDNQKMSSNAWEAFTQSQAIRMPKVDHGAFRPDKEPGEVWARDGESFVNTYRRLAIARKQGDPSLFLDHLAIVLPHQRDRDILLAYMAAVVQHPGIKFQWAPLIQGVEGNGKTLFSRCVAEAVGFRYTHLPKAAELAEKFNGWLSGKIFIGVEDVYYPGAKTEIIETLKPMITNERQPIRHMGRAEVTMDICANFIVNSNHKDAIRKTANDRRWCILFCAQQSREDKARDGLTPKYFQDLYKWLRADGYAIVSEFLYSYAIPAEFGLDCLCGDAPMTSSTEEAIACGLGQVEQEVMERIQRGSAGFSGGWVSSIALDNVLREEKMEKAMPRVKRRDMMVTLGYDWHPGLRGGRCTTNLPNTADRPVLFVKRGHWSVGMDEGRAIMDAYLAAQQPGAKGELGVVFGAGAGVAR